MKIAAGTNLNSGSARRERGSIVLILLLLLAIMGMYLASNNLALHQLQIPVKLMQGEIVARQIHPHDDEQEKQDQHDGTPLVPS